LGWKVLSRAVVHQEQQGRRRFAISVSRSRTCPGCRAGVYQLRSETEVPHHHRRFDDAAAPARGRPTTMKSVWSTTPLPTSRPQRSRLRSILWSMILPL